jgi:Xaa-Pro aminopeptidase
MRQSFDETTDPSYGPRHLPLIRRAMADQGLDGFIVPHEDEHQNEYLPAANDRLAWATGFTGSAGAAMIMTDKAALFVDGRYALQAPAQVDQDMFEIKDLMDGGVPAWIEATAKAGQVLGYDPRLHSPDSLARLEAAAVKAGASMMAVSDNPLDAAWGTNRPAQPAAPVVPHTLQYSGEASAEKRRRIGLAMNADAAVLTAPASIAWLFNIRGGDVIRSPLPLGQAILRKDGSADLFLDPAKITPGLAKWLDADVALRDPSDLQGALAKLSNQIVSIDPAQSSAWYFSQLETAGARIYRMPDPTALPRAIKNAVEIAGARAAHSRDGAALTNFLHWIVNQNGPIEELAAVAQLEAFREATGVLKDLSFDTIAGAGPNGAVVHYHPTIKTSRAAQDGDLLLVDSGGQYLDGTTDVTRTVSIGTPREEMRQRFTLVLKGHLALARVRFPAGITGSLLDALARGPLWAQGLDYDHGTGHGVGSYLGVHEGPQGISKRAGGAPLQPGMIVSNEPGYYKTGAYGIRIENLQVVTQPTEIAGGERAMLGFETLTLAPIDRKLIAVCLLTAEERAQLDAYHARVLAEIGPQLGADARAWLEQVCAPL